MKKIIWIAVMLCLILTACGGEPISDETYRKYAPPFAETSSEKDKTETATTENETSGISTDFTSVAVSSITCANNSAKSDNANKSEKNNSKKSIPTINGSGQNSASIVVSESDGSSAIYENNPVEYVDVYDKEQSTDNTTSHSNEITESTTLSPLKDTDTAYITLNGDRYHREGCRYLAKSCIAIIVGEAKEKGYIPCKICKP